MLCYLSVGLAAIVSPVGVAGEILRACNSPVGCEASNNDEWYENLRALYRDRKLALAIGSAGRQVVMESYSVQRNVKLLADIFMDVARA